MAEGHHANYWLIFLALCVCTALSVVADLIQLDNKFVVAVIVLAIASAKALFVMTFGVGLVLAPWLGTQVMTHVGPRALWIVSLGASLASALAFARVYSPRPSTPGGTT